ncbi:MAG: hypothetical protein HFH87_07100 [Lachnospiraceae bacterium]|nr:hypothetical protein [Lachnospiraceae bacterium]
MRLIDADTFCYEIIKYLPRSFESTENLVNAWKQLVEQQPTAYDVDKVVERLKKEIGDCMCAECDRHADCDTCRAEKAVEIVKSGGIE